MAVRIRMRRMGNRNRPFFRIVVADSRSPRDGRFIQELGYYDPLSEERPFSVKDEPALLWLQRGAKVSDSVRSIFKKAGLWEKWQAHRDGKPVAAPVQEAPSIPEPVVTDGATDGEGTTDLHGEASGQES